MYYVYFLKSLKNNKIYVGYTCQDVFKRLKQHDDGTSTWTKQNDPFELIYYEKLFCKEDALIREKFYKSGFGKQIKTIIIKELSNRNNTGGFEGP